MFNNYSPIWSHLQPREKRRLFLNSLLTLRRNIVERVNIPRGECEHELHEPGVGGVLEVLEDGGCDDFAKIVDSVAG